MRILFKIFIGFIFILAILILIAGVLMFFAASPGSLDSGTSFGPLGIQNPPLAMMIAGGIISFVCLFLLFII